jgi:hypothetical protein
VQRLGDRRRLDGHLLGRQCVQGQPRDPDQRQPVQRHREQGGTLLTCSTSITTNIVAGAQVSRVPTGAVGTGGGSTAGLQDTRLLMLGAGLLLAAAISALLGWRVPRRD